MKFKILSAVLGASLFLNAHVTSECKCLTPEQREILGLLSLVKLQDCVNSSGYKTVRLTGANLQIVNGLDDTETVNGVGNLLIGYQEIMGFPCDRSGSHNIIGGDNNSYTSFGGLAVGDNSFLLSQYSSILGGVDNAVTSPTSVVVGGASNEAGGLSSVVVGGQGNDVSPISNGGVVVGGVANVSASHFGTILGGNSNATRGSEDVIVGGWNNRSIGTYATTVGGFNNSANGLFSTVSGGTNRVVVGDGNWRAGSLFEDN